MLILLLVVLVTVSDQIVKLIVESRLPELSSVTVIPNIFNLTYVQNTGAAYGMFSSFRAVLVIVSVVMIICMISFRRHFISEHRIDHVSFGLIIGGIIGNLIDRVKLGYVIDFLDFHWGASHFPSFNIADSAICIGVGLYLIAQFRKTPEKA